MTSNHQNAANDLRNRDAATIAPLERRTTSSSYSTSNRFSIASNDTGESTAAASKRNSLAADPGNVQIDGTVDSLQAAKPVKDGRGSHRSHKSRNSGGFILSDSSFEPPPTISAAAGHAPKRTSSQADRKGKAASRALETKHTKRRSEVGLGIGGSPLAANFETVGTNGVGGDSTADDTHGSEHASGAKAAASGLDVDSAQIVNLALNLSESRRAARRNVSLPMPPPVGTFGESFAVGSLRQHLQQQRRVSRNVSPKPDRGDRANTASPRFASGQRVNSPLKSAFETDQDGSQYHFSASTLARAEKAKNTLELMAHYRRLLQCVPPLKPQFLERFTTAGSNFSESPLATSRPTSNTATAPRPLGREYNPLQYIRNRKVRLRERRAIDGEAQGFGDVDKVSSWVDQVSTEALSGDYQASDCLFMPTFSKAADTAASPHQSPPSTLGKAQAAQVKIKRPRVDWITSPADLIADVFWLEQDNNKKSIEDRNGRMIFPQSTELKRPVSRRGDEAEKQLTPKPTIQREQTKSPDLRIDTKLPEFRSNRSDSEKHSSNPASRAKQKLREATRIHHSHNGSIPHYHIRVRSHSRSNSDSSESEAAQQPKRRRSGTADSHDRGKDILEKQMIEMLARETSNSKWGPEDHESQNIFSSGRVQKPLPNSASLRNGSSGRASLEVPGFGPRGSLEELDSTAPNSPRVEAAKVTNCYIPSIGMDLSPLPRSRTSSPTPNLIAGVKARINHLQDYTRDRSRSRAPQSDAATPTVSGSSKEATSNTPKTPEREKRSQSPMKKIISRRTDDSSRSSVTKAGSIRRGKTGDEASGIRGLFKGSRNPATRVSDFIWKKDISPGGPLSGFSTDESDAEDILGTSEKKDSRNSSITMQPSPYDIVATSTEKEKSSYRSDLPVFSSPFSEHRGRPTRTQSDEMSENDRTDERQGREDRRRSSRARMLEPPPRIDVQNASPTSSPDLPPQDRNRDSSASDFDSRRNSLTTGVFGADARLNAILGRPGHRNDNLFVTGLAGLETSNHHPSLRGKRHWSISDRGVSVHRGPMTQAEIARVKTLLLSSGIKAKEISRRAAELKDLHDTDEKTYADIAPLAQRKVAPVRKSQEHVLASKILADDIQLSAHMFQTSADTFTDVTVQNLLDRIETFQSRLVNDLTPMTRKAADEADGVSKDLVTSQTLKVKRIMDSMDKMMRLRRRRFRWLRRGGWVLVEWALVGVMWLVWFVVVLVRVVMGVGRGVVGMGRWLAFR